MMNEHAVKPIVYVVDDDPSMLRALSRLLTLTGHAVETFPSATDFLARHQPTNRGCVVADLRMPGPSGLDLQSALAAAAIRCRSSSSPATETSPPPSTR